ncbi:MULTISPECIES: hypothetical protein [Photorhabdus]|uniref:hypothetical protein n=1 Tax=Photorhabdus TaxID=29487 RepID=UPI001E331DBE|nr:MULTISPECIES: hypothetical protein [Photorhabdus]
MVDKYGTGQDPYTYPGIDTLINKLAIRDPVVLEQAERELTELAILNISFQEPPYHLLFWRQLHKQIFSDLYPMDFKMDRGGKGANPREHR